MKAYPALSFVLISLAFGQKNQIFKGDCPKITIKENFSETQFAGEWYEIKRFTNSLVTGDCGNPNYIKSSVGFDVSFFTRNITGNITNELNIVLKHQQPAEVGRYDVFINDVKQNIPHLILDTDYTSFGVIWGCQYSAMDNTNQQILSIFSKESTLDSDTLTEIISKLKSQQIDVTKLEDVEQGDVECARTSTASLLYPSIIATLMITLLKVKL